MNNNGCKLLGKELVEAVGYMASAVVLRWEEKEGFKDPGMCGSHRGWTVTGLGGLPWGLCHGAGEAELRFAGPSSGNPRLVLPMPLWSGLRLGL